MAGFVRLDKNPSVTSTPKAMPRPRFVVSWKALVFAAIFPTALSAATYTHNFNSLATDTPNGAINTALVLSGACSTAWPPMPP